MSDSSGYSKVYAPLFWTPDTFGDLAVWLQRHGTVTVRGYRPPWMNFDWHDPKQIGQLVEGGVDLLARTAIGNGPAWSVFVPEEGLATIASKDGTFLDRKVLTPVKSAEVSDVSKMVKQWLMDDPQSANDLLWPACLLRDLIIANRHEAQLAVPKMYFEQTLVVLQQQIGAASSRGNRDLSQRLQLVSNFVGSYAWQDASTFETKWKRADFDQLTSLMAEYELQEASKVRGALSFANFHRLASELESSVKKALGNPRVSAALDITQDGIGLCNPAAAAAVDISRKLPALAGAKKDGELPRVSNMQFPFEILQAFMSMPVLGDPLQMPRILYLYSWYETAGNRA